MSAGPDPGGARRGGALALALSVALVAGCAAGRDYRAPEIAAPAAWQAPVPDAGLDAVRWSAVFDDPLLVVLVGEALAVNHDLRLAASRLLEARAARRQAAAGLGPTLDAGATAERRRRSEGVLGDGPPASGDSEGHYRVGLEAGWEIDLFGRVRRGVEAADADLAALVAGRGAVATSIAAETALAYLEARSLAERAALARTAVVSYGEALALARSLAGAGLASSVTLAQAEGDLAQTAAQVPAFERLRVQALHRLDLLLAQHPGHAARRLAAAPPAAPPDGALAVLAPADLLRRRPDLAQAERELAAASARVGMAQADLYPRLSLTGAFAYESVSASDLVSAPNRAWSFGPTLRLPLFSSGRLRAAIRVAEARQEQALIRYEQVALRAFAEVEDALTALARDRERCQALATAAAARATAQSAADERFARGIDGYAVVLEQRRLQRDTEDLYAQARLAAAQDLVVLARALGGGWRTPERSP